MRSLVLIPEGKISWGKLSQSLDYGAVTCQLRTDFDGCVKVLNELVRRMPVYLLNSVNPYRLEGQKTAAIELLEQLAWQPPDHIIVPGGNLGNSSALGKALLEMKDLGLISRLPKLSVDSSRRREPFLSQPSTNMAEINSCRCRLKLLRLPSASATRHPGRKRCASSKPLEARSSKSARWRWLWPRPKSVSDGVGCEPASAVTLAGLKKLVKQGFVKHERDPWF